MLPRDPEPNIARGSILFSTMDKAAYTVLVFLYIIFRVLEIEQQLKVGFPYTHHFTEENGFENWQISA